MLRIMQNEHDGKVPLEKVIFGSVFLGIYNGGKVAIKRVALNQVTSDIEEKALQQLNHPNVIKLYDSKNDNNFKYFAMELCAASLDQLFLQSDDPRKYRGPKLPPQLTVFLQLASGLEYIHSKKLFHRNIKPSNVLIFIDSTTGLVIMKWADFGLSKFVNERGKLNEIKGNTNYFAPELLKRLTSDEELGRGTIKSDVFSFALVIGYLLLDGQHLYGFNYFCIPGNIWSKNLNKINKIGRSHYARHLLKKMLKTDPNKRISSEEVVKELESIKIKLVKIKEEFRKQSNTNNLDRNKLKFLIQNGINVNRKDIHGLNELHLLCRYNSSEKIVDAMQILIQNGIDVNGKDIMGRNALHHLCICNTSEKLIDAIQYLIQNGIDVKGKDNEGWNALHHLCICNSSEKIISAIQLLIQNGIDVNEKTNYGQNALHLMCLNDAETESEKLIDAIQFLIQNGIDVNGKDNDGKNALHLLYRWNSGWTEAMQLLIENGIQSNGLDARSLLRLQYNKNAVTVEEIERVFERAANSN